MQLIYKRTNHIQYLGRPLRLLRSHAHTQNIPQPPNHLTALTLQAQDPSAITKSAMHPQVELLLNYAANATPFVSSTGQAFLSLPLDAFSQQVSSVHSPRIRDWLIAAFDRDHHQPPSPYALRQTIRTLAARANCSGTSVSVQRRVASRGNPRHPDAILLDLANPQGEIVEITPQGWQVTTHPATPFLHSRGNIELPPPNQQPATNNQPLPILQRLLNLTEADAHRATVWLLAALHPHGPHPILVLEGPPSSGKSTAARMLRAIIDPSAAPLYSLPSSEPELLALATLNWILAFDHTGQVRPNISATLCRLATGAAVRQREKGDDREPTVQELHRPILITAASGWNPGESLANRALTLRLKPLSTRRTEAELFQEFEAIRPTLLAALCHATATALSAKPPVPSAQTTAPRLPDAAHWAIAGFPQNAPAIRAAMNQAPTTPILESVAEFLKTSPQWTGTATDLLHEIAVTTVTAPALSHHLRSHKNQLASQNIALHFTRKHGGSRQITLTTSGARAPRHIQ